MGRGGGGEGEGRERRVRGGDEREDGEMYLEKMLRIKQVSVCRLSR